VKSIALGSLLAASQVNAVNLNPPPPVAPAQWSATIDTTITAGGQTQKGTTKSYISDTHQAWRYESTTHPSTLTLFDYKDGREMELDSTGTKCVAWCPPSSTYFNTIRVGNGKNGTSKATYDGTNTWSWTDNLFVIAMDHKHLTFKSGAVPDQLVEEFTPFGKQIGNGTSIFHDDFKPSADESKFTVSNLDSCPKADNCQSSTVRLTTNVKQLLLEIGMMEKM
jgi:hypothetical protein